MGTAYGGRGFKERARVWREVNRHRLLQRALHPGVMPNPLHCTGHQLCTSAFMGHPIRTFLEDTHTFLLSFAKELQTPPGGWRPAGRRQGVQDVGGQEKKKKLRTSGFWGPLQTGPNQRPTNEIGRLTASSWRWADSDCPVPAGWSVAVRPHSRQVMPFRSSFAGLHHCGSTKGQHPTTRPECALGGRHTPHGPVLICCAAGFQSQPDVSSAAECALGTGSTWRSAVLLQKRVTFLIPDSAFCIHFIMPFRP